MTLKQLNSVKELVYSRKIGPISGKILEQLVLNSHKKFKLLTGKQISEISVEELSEKLEMTGSNIRCHLRILEERGYLIQFYLFPDCVIEGYKDALKKGVRAMVGQCYLLKIEGEK